MLNPDWSLPLRLLLVALPMAAAIWFFATGWVVLGALFTGLTGWVFARLFMAPPGGPP